MPRALRTLLLLVLMLPAALLPQGVRLSWCRCASADPVCCAEPEVPACCAVREAEPSCCARTGQPVRTPEEPGQGLDHARDCACCPHVQADSCTGTGTLERGPDVLPPAALSWAEVVLPGFDSEARPCPRAPRGPPDLPPPVALRPGGAPLRL